MSDYIVDQYRKDPNEQVFLESVGDIDKTFPKLDMKLDEIGIPPLHILRVVDGITKHYVELSGDEKIVSFQ